MTALARGCLHSIGLDIVYIELDIGYISNYTVRLQRSSRALWYPASARGLDLIDQIVHGCYLGFSNFELAAAFAMFYFAGAHNSEDARRRGRAGPGSAFLLADMVHASGVLAVVVCGLPGVFFVDGRRGWADDANIS
jgi:hypothetical protein